jgi:orotate phosphoribosyltransferase
MNSLAKVRRNVRILHGRAVDAMRTKKDRLTFISLSQLCQDVMAWTVELPPFDVVAGVPRSGMLVASLIGLKLGKPISTPDLLRRGLAWPPESQQEHLEKIAFEKVLLVDDTVNSGYTIDWMKRKLARFQVITGAVYASPTAVRRVDICYQTVTRNRILEWGLYGKTSYGRIAADLDGVICTGTDSDIIKGIINAKPLFIPPYAFAAIISNRDESTRTITEGWLERHGVKYEKLYLLQTENDRPLHKIRALKEVKPLFYIESDDQLAKIIHDSLGIPVLCFDTKEMYS